MPILVENKLASGKERHGTGVRVEDDINLRPRVARVTARLNDKFGAKKVSSLSTLNIPVVRQGKSTH